VNLFIAHPADEVYPLNVFRVRIVALGEPLLHSMFTVDAARKMMGLQSVMRELTGVPSGRRPSRARWS